MPLVAATVVALLCAGLIAARVAHGDEPLPTPGKGARIAARVGDGTITLADVDRCCGDKCGRLLATQHEREQTTLRELVDQLLLARVPEPRPTAVPVTEQDVDRYLATHPGEFRGPPERDRAAVRFYLEREGRRELDARLIAGARQHEAVELHVERLDTESGATDDVLARVGTQTIQRRDVEARAALALYHVRGELARERLRQLEAAIAERLWADAAAQRGIAVATLRAEVVSLVPPVSDADIERYFATEQRAQDPQAQKHPERIRPYLEFRSRHAAEETFLAQRRRESGVTVLLAEPSPPRFALPPAIGGERGADKADVHVVLLTSYRGEASRVTWALARELATAPGVALAVRPLLPQWDPEATRAAAAVRCGAAQGRFWEMQDAVASAKPLPGPTALLALARAAGLDEASFAACSTSPATAAAVAADSAVAERLGIVEPPVLLVDGVVLGTAPSRERLTQAIAAARAPAATPSPSQAAVSAPSS